MKDVDNKIVDIDKHYSDLRNKYENTIDEKNSIINKISDQIRELNNK